MNWFKNSLSADQNCTWKKSYLSASDGRYLLFMTDEFNTDFNQ